MRSLSLAAAIVVLASFAAADARADSRLFSVRTDQPDVTIDQVSFNGKPLGVAGKGGGVTFFRIENPAGAIPCGGHFQFTASNGLRSQADVDLCKVNWELTLPAYMGWIAKPPTAPKPKPPGPVTVIQPNSPALPAPPEPSGPRTVTITTDDPGTAIQDVYLEKTPMTVVARGGNSVQIVIPSAGPAIKCERDLGLRLADGRTVARRVNVCANNWSVLVMLAGDTSPTPAPPVVAPAPPPPVGPTAPPAPLSQWSFNLDNGDVSLVNGVPNTDEIEIAVSCRAGTSQSSVTVGRAVDGLTQGQPVAVTLNAGAFSRTYSAVGSLYNDMVGGSQPQFALKISDPLWSALAAERQLVIAAAGQQPYVISLKGSSAPVRQFIANCAPPPVVINTPPPPGPFDPPPGPLGPPGPFLVPPADMMEADGLDYRCDDGSQINVVFNRHAGTALVREGGSQPRLLPQMNTPPGQEMWAAGPFRLFGEEEDLTYNRPGRPPRSCGLDE